MRYALLILVVLFADGCSRMGDDRGGRDGGTGPDPFEGDSEITLLLSGTPAGLAHAWVVVGEVVLIGGETRDERFPLYTGPGEWIDLLANGSGPMELAKTMVPAGNYRQLLLLVDAAAIETADGLLFATEGADPPGDAEPDGVLTCSACAATSIRVTSAGRTPALGGPQETFLVEFVVDESFTFPQDRPDDWSLRPVLRLQGDDTE